MSDQDYYGGNSGPADAQPSQPAQDPYSALGELGYDEYEVADVRDTLSRVIGGEVQQAVAPLERELESLRGEQAQQELQEELIDLEQQYPELQRQDVADKILAQTRAYAEERGLHPSAAWDPDLIEYFYLKQNQGAGQGRGQRQPDWRRQDTLNDEQVNDALISQAGPKNFWGY